VLEPPLTGGCLCGAVRFELDEPPSGAGYCHCTRCQRRTGTAWSASAWVDGRHFRLTSGEEQLRSWRHPDGGWEKLFCGQCGAHIISRDPEDRARIGVRMGAFDRDPGVRPQHHQYVAYAAAWAPLPDDGLPRYREARPANA
jgi:hypothetical protein